MEDPGLGPLPVNGSLALVIETDEKGERRTIKLGGRPSIRLRPPSASSAEDEITISLEGRLDSVIGGDTRLAAHLSSASDDLDIEAILKPGERPHLQVSSPLTRSSLSRHGAFSVENRTCSRFTRNGMFHY